MPKEKTTKNPTKKTQTTEKNGSQIILETLLQQGVIDVFGSKKSFYISPNSCFCNWI